MIRAAPPSTVVRLDRREPGLPEQAPFPYWMAWRSLLRCIASTASLLLGRRMHLPREHVRMTLRFADGTSAWVFRETVVDRSAIADPCVLVVAFRLKLVRGKAHALFRRESLFNTPLFVGFPGFVSKLWLANDEHDVYRGFYQWDGPERAVHYARSLWRVLALGSVRGSIHYQVLPGLRRDDVLAHPEVLAARSSGTEWWRLVEVIPTR